MLSHQIFRSSRNGFWILTLLPSFPASPTYKWKYMIVSNRAVTLIVKFWKLRQLSNYYKCCTSTWLQIPSELMAINSNKTVTCQIIRSFIQNYIFTIKETSKCITWKEEMRMVCTLLRSMRRLKGFAEIDIQGFPMENNRSLFAGYIVFSADSSSENRPRLKNRMRIRIAETWRSSCVDCSHRTQMEILSFKQYQRHSQKYEERAEPPNTIRDESIASRIRAICSFHFHVCLLNASDDIKRTAILRQLYWT